MADEPIKNSNEFPEPSEEIEEGLTVEGSDVIIDREDYDEDELEHGRPDWEEDLAESGTFYDTQHTDGHTYDPDAAWDQGLTYTPPTDPPTIVSDDPQGVEIAAGFAPGMEETDPDVEELPPNVDNNAYDLQEDVYLALLYNSETSNLADQIIINVVDGVVVLEGVVPDDQDISLIDEIVNDLNGVMEVDNRLTTEI